VLDQQLQAQILSFEQVRGTVRQIDQDSAQLRAALTGEQARIVITTLQKFPFVLRQLTDEGAELKDRTYAVIVDEAHSSQTGESAADVKRVLGSRSAEDLGLDPDEVDGVPPSLLASLAGRGEQPNISFFAFTATPKARTLELFRHRSAKGSMARPFHTYSMRQAVEEGFIVDVLRNYTTYDQLYRLESETDEKLDVPKGKARARLTAFARFHPYAKDQKAKVIVDHYRQVVRARLGGEAKGMIVAASRQEAVRYKQAVDSYIEREGYADVQSLVAFSGEVTIKDPEAADVGESYTEPQMNRIGGQPLPESKLPEEFEKPAYGVLIVAEKYQTGFDQPKLCAMYVDKLLSGVNAVQTLSRLNRSYPGKREVFVLDFVNSTDDILDAFEPFFGRTEATPTDPNVLFDAADTIIDFGIVSDQELDDFAADFFDRDSDHSTLSAKTQAAYDRARELDEDELESFRDSLDRFTRLYAFLSQVVRYLPPDTEKLYVFCRVLAQRLIEQSAEGGLSLNVRLTHYRLDEIATESIGLDDSDPEPLKAVGGDGTGAKSGDVPMGLLSELVALFNDRFSAELSDADAVRPIQQVIDKVGEDEGLRDQALANDFDDFNRGKESVVIGATLDVKDVNDLVLQKLLDDEDVRARATHLIMRSLYERFQEESEQAAG
jgi:type I restriction enzyme R subunit